VALQTELQLEVFQGPLDLLLTLIERRRLEITEISLAAVADQYLQAVRALPEPDTELLAEFVVIGARLLLLKSRALLPQPRSEEEEEPLDDLTDRLEQYRRFKELAQLIASRVESGQQAFQHPARPELAELQPTLAPLDAAVLARLWRSLAHRAVMPARVDDAPRARISVAARLEGLRELLRDSAELRWEQVAGETLDELIATFLAVLELVRRSELRVVQEGCFGPIRLQALRFAPVATNGQAVRHESE
jgi:segregation and condensation protein A